MGRSGSRTRGVRTEQQEGNQHRNLATLVTGCALGETGGAEPTPRQYDDQSCSRTNCKRRRAREHCLLSLSMSVRAPETMAPSRGYRGSSADPWGTRSRCSRYSNANIGRACREPKHSADIPKCRAGQNQRSPSASEYKIEFLLVGLATAKKTRNQNVSTSFTNFGIRGWRKE